MKLSVKAGYILVEHVEISSLEDLKEFNLDQIGIEFRAGKIVAGATADLGITVLYSVSKPFGFVNDLVKVDDVLIWLSSEVAPLSPDLPQQDEPQNDQA